MNKRIIVQTTDKLLWLEQIDEGLWRQLDEFPLAEDVRGIYFLMPPRPLTEKELEWGQLLTIQFKTEKENE